MNSELIKAKRKELKLSQSELAEEVGVTRQTIVNIEHNKVDDTRISTIIKLAKTLRVTIDDLLIF